MQKSTAVAARAIVMLACLVLIPLVALFGGSLPELATKFLEGRLGRAAASSGPSGDHLAEAPEFRPEEAPPFLPGKKGGLDTGAVPAGAGTSCGVEVAAGYEVPIVSPNPGTSGLAAGRSPSTPPPSGQADLGQSGFTGKAPSKIGPPAALSGKATGSPAVHPPSGTEEIGPAGSPSGGNPRPPAAKGGTFVLIQERLRDLGAVYYRLESWGSKQQLFRFQCEMAVEGSPGLTRHFEAVDSHPLLAMHKVLAEAEAWHASR